ncbi:TetR/AcrR family transcriptional regulator [Cryptosporangium sp. NPDC051539]|uniref:TetR/AcrR family transcriptional regulator n=1 Tax=Cryptosporangium sp. NPDC051539 TaxID=3363962 RepID=UPI00378F473B
MTLTAKGAATRRRIVAGAAAEVRERGVIATTLDDIRARTGTSKSQLFHYFPDGKDQLLLEVARFEADRVIDDQQPYLGNLTSWAAWEAWRDTVLSRYRAQGRHCPLSVVTSQLGRTTPGAQAVVSELVRRWQAELSTGIRAMQSTGDVRPELDPEATAAAVIAGLQGGVLIMLSTGELTHLAATLDLALAYLRG